MSTQAFDIYRIPQKAGKNIEPFRKKNL